MANWSDFMNELKKDDTLREALESQEYMRSRLVFKHRMKLKLSQIELAKRANVTQKTISRIEGADIGVRESTLKKVFEALEISENEISATREYAVH